jgi:hypothetical protein
MPASANQPLSSAEAPPNKSVEGPVNGAKMGGAFFGMSAASAAPLTAQIAVALKARVRNLPLMICPTQAEKFNYVIFYTSTRSDETDFVEFCSGFSNEMQRLTSFVAE